LRAHGASGALFRFAFEPSQRERGRFRDRVTELLIGNSREARLQFRRQLRHAPWRRLLRLSQLRFFGPHAEPNLLHTKTKLLEAIDDLAREQTELLRPRRRSDEHGQLRATERPHFGALRDAPAYRVTPGLAVHGDSSAPEGELSRALEDVTERRGTLSGSR
jgi:hypothetical protein